jgi:hypothetical protein
MRKTQLGAGWTKGPSPVLRGRSAESSTGQRAATYNCRTARVRSSRRSWTNSFATVYLVSEGRLETFGDLRRFSTAK